MPDPAEEKRFRLDPRMLEMLVCPLTKTRLTLSDDKSELISVAARLAFPIRKGVPLMVLDAARLDLTGLEAPFRAALVPLILFDALWDFAYMLAERRDHVMLEGRRYMKKITDY